VSSPEQCEMDGEKYSNNSTLCVNGTEFYCRNSVWDFVGSCVAEQNITTNCTRQNSTYVEGAILCEDGISLECQKGNFSYVGLCVAEQNITTNCTRQNASYLEGDFLCEDGISLECQKGNFTAVGLCDPSELVNCSRLNAKCVVTFSYQLSVSVVYCGKNESFASAQSLCYHDEGMTWCDNNRLGSKQNWIVTSEDTRIRGFKCPIL
jgi:hypothetical protein